MPNPLHSLSFPLAPQTPPPLLTVLLSVRTKQGSSVADNGIVDSLFIKESAIRLAVDAALTVLRVDQIIMSKPAGTPATAPP